MKLFILTDTDIFKNKDIVTFINLYRIADIDNEVILVKNFKEEVLQYNAYSNLEFNNSIECNNSLDLNKDFPIDNDLNGNMNNLTNTQNIPTNALTPTQNIPTQNTNNTTIEKDLGYILCKYKKNIRILLTSSIKTHSSSYLKLLNSSFTSKRLNIRIDVYSLYNNPILRQCTIITNGLFVNNLKGLISILGTKSNNIQIVSYRVKCLCHGKSVLVGLVCAVCLGVYCTFVAVCKRCKSKFNFNMVK